MLASVKFDVAIVGAGLSGFSLAVALAAAGRRVAVIDARSPAPARPPREGFDPRVYAISPASARWLAGLHIWQALDSARLSPVYDMRVVGDGAGNLASRMDLSAYKSGIGELCTIVEESELMRALAGAAGFAPGIELVRPASPARLRSEVDRVFLTLADGRVLDAELVVACDGGQSWTRAAAGIEVDTIAYGQTAIVANFNCAHAHHGRALQWFRNEDAASASVLAWLPLPGRCISIVWSLEAGLADRMMALDDAEFARRAAAAGGNVLGEFTMCGKRVTFPLSNQRPRGLVGARVALAGDAAHLIHPLAGQGLNLGFGDCAALARSLAGARDCGAPGLLRAYERERKAALLEMHTVTHGLARLFASRHPALRALRNIGLNLSARLPVVPRLIVRAAMH